MSEWKNIFCETFKKVSAKFTAFFCLIAIIAFFGITVLGIMVFMKPHVSDLYTGRYAFIETQHELKPEEKEQIDLLIAKNSIIPITSVYEDTMRYYDNIITLLIALLGVFAFASWFYIGGKLHSKMRDDIHEEFQSNWFNAYLICKSKEFITDYLKANLSDYAAEQMDDEKIRGIVNEELEKKQRIDNTPLDQLENEPGA